MPLALKLWGDRQRNFFETENDSQQRGRVHRRTDLWDGGGAAQDPRWREFDEEVCNRTISAF
jgi:hypothetical protein